MDHISTLTTEINKNFEDLNLSVLPNKLYEPIRYILSLGGKRIRPLLTLIAAQMFGDSPYAAMPQALSIEIFHNFTLLHDDIMDEAPLRRNRPTVHLKWNINTGILSGDAMLIKAYQLIEDTPSVHLPEILKLFNATAIGVCEGQQYDMEFETRSDIDINQYMEMIRLKTAILLGCALKTGSIIGGASPEESKDMYAIGIAMGIAFQLQDDILDVFGTQIMGKRIGGDILANKKTILLLLALDFAQGEMADDLQYLMSADNLLPEDKIRRVMSIYVSLDVKRMAESKVSAYCQTARDLIDALDIELDRKSNLISIFNRLLSRSY